MSTHQLFELEWTDGPAQLWHQRSFGDIERDYPWESLDKSRYPAALLDRARLGWTENAFNEFCTAIAMGQLIDALGKAQAPMDLLSLASRFPSEEFLHVELCARMAMRLGGGAPIQYNPEDMGFVLDPSLTPLQRANELVVRICCVGEAFSFPLLSGCMRAAAHPLTKKVLTKIVQDEALHGRLGFLYLEWASDRMDKQERDRLGRIAQSTLEEYLPLWEGLRSQVKEGRSSEGFLMQHIYEIGWMDSQSYKTLARESMLKAVTFPLRKFGIRVPKYG